MKIINTNFKGLKLIKHKKFKDKRGYLKIIYNKKIIKPYHFVHEYCTNSKKNSLRGFHFQYKYLQAKYVSVLKGKILDCVIDLRKGSKTFLKVYKTILSDKNNKALFIPCGFAHAYYSLGSENIIYYKVTNYYKPNFEDGINPLDKKLKINWPGKKFNISSKDKKLGNLENFLKKFKYL